MADLSQSTIDVIKATAPVVEEHGLAITKRFYENLFENHPYVNQFFNKSHVFPENGGISPQAKALANAVFAYASNIDDLGKLTDAIGIIAQKHVSFQVPPNSYQDVGTELLKSIKEILGDAATDEIMAAWKEGYFFLANTFINLESQIKKEQLDRLDGWNGFEKLQVVKISQETEDIKSFYLKGIEGKSLPKFDAGQYLSFKTTIGNQTMVRNYSISSGENAKFLNSKVFRISVKKELLPPDHPGIISNHLHNEVKVGDILDVGMPCGTFTLRNNNRPIVLIGGGIGITPMLSMLETLADNKDSRSVKFIHCVKTAQQHAFASHVDNLIENLTHISAHTFYSQPTKKNTACWRACSENGHLENTDLQYGRLGKASLTNLIEKPQECEFYFCGPKALIVSILEILKSLQVPQNQISYEYFGPQLQ